MDEEWSNAHSLEMDAWFLEILILFFEKMMMMISLFLKMNKAWSNARSLEMDEWFLEILVFIFWKDDDDLPLLFWKWTRQPMWILRKSYYVGTFNKEKRE